MAKAHCQDIVLFFSLFLLYFYLRENPSEEKFCLKKNIIIMMNKSQENAIFNDLCSATFRMLMITGKVP